MEKVVERLRATFPEERNLTLDELKRRPPGKGVAMESGPTKYKRSYLHDDITAIILHFTSDAGSAAQQEVAKGLASDERTAAELAATETLGALVRRRRRLLCSYH